MRSLIKLFLVAVLITASGHSFAVTHNPINADSTQMVDPRLSGFTKIKIAGPFEVHLKQGSEESVKYQEPEDVAGRIVAEVSGGVLKIHKKYDNWSSGYKSWYSEKGAWNNHKKILVYITAKELKGITVSGSGTISFNDGLTAPELNLKVRGSGEMTGKIEVKKLWSHVSGSGSIKLSGNAENSAVKVVGSGKFTGGSLVTSSSAAQISGSGNAEVNASDKLDAVVHGSGVVRYAGAPKSIKRSTSGSGEIHRL